MKVLHCPTDTGGHAWGLSRAERRLGVESDVMVRRSSWLRFPADIDLDLRTASFPVALFRLTRFLVAAARRYDVFHLNWGMSLLDHRGWHLHYWDLPILKRLGKRIVVTFQGCDVRMKTASRERFETSACAECDVRWCTARLDRIRQVRLRKVLRYADRLFVLNPDLLHVAPSAQFLPYASVDPGEWRYQPPVASGAHVKVVHLPTNRRIKGTGYIEDACRALQAEGLAIDLMLVERVSHYEARRLLAEADLVIDQLLVGWYGAVAVEAMALGKPVLCFLRQSDVERFVPFGFHIPIIKTTKETLKEDLRALIARRSLWGEIARNGRRYVEQYHDPMQVAVQTIAAYGDMPRASTLVNIAHASRTAIC